MLLRIELGNFYSICEAEVLEFRLPRTTPESSRYGRCNLPKDERAPHVITLFGANASGKTNFLRAITFMWSFAVESFDRYKTDDNILVLPFNRKDKRSGVTTLAMEFVPATWMVDRVLSVDHGDASQRLYRYELEIDHSSGRGVVQKEAIRWSEGGRVFTTLFDRRLNGDSYDIRAHRDFELHESDPRRGVRKNVSLISSLVQFEHPPALKIRQMLKLSFFSNFSLQKFPKDEKIVTEFLDMSESMLEVFNRKIRTIDLGIERLEIREIKGEKTPLFFHSGLDAPQTFAFESEGTKSFYRNFVDIFLALGSGGVAVMDELDADLHPNLMGEVIRWFQDPNENPFGAQIIMSCHNASLISDLEKDEVWLIAKDDVGRSTASSIAKYKGLRRDTNLYAKYLSGALGAVPRFG